MRAVSAIPETTRVMFDVVIGAIFGSGFQERGIRYGRNKSGIQLDPDGFFCVRIQGSYFTIKLGLHFPRLMNS